MLFPHVTAQGLNKLQERLQDGSRRNCLIFHKKFVTCLSFALLSLINLNCAGTSPSVKMKETRPEALGLSAEYFSYNDKVIMESINRGDIPGAVVVVGYRNRVVYRKAFGNRSLEPVRRPMRGFEPPTCALRVLK